MVASYVMYKNTINLPHTTTMTITLQATSTHDMHNVRIIDDTDKLAGIISAHYIFNHLEVRKT